MKNLIFATRHWLWILIVLILPTSLFSTLAMANDLVAKVNGKFEVNQSSMPTYTIPLELPPGINGLQPELALAYRDDSLRWYL